MAKNTKKNSKKITHELLLDAYINYTLTEGKRPSSVYAFAKNIGIEESDFYGFSPSFDGLESDFFSILFQKTLQTLANTEDYDSFSPKEKLLSFYFTFFENLKANRSFAIFSLEPANPLKLRRALKDLKQLFTQYLNQIEVEKIDLKKENLNQIVERSVQEMGWAQFMGILRFWMNDTSTDFEKTDLLIEKSTDVGLDLIDPKILNKWVDLGKFLWKEKPF
ncbi:TetR/AcrR family transcriptional regulator [Ornithobacterium rhinotracheale]|uniref:TetR family transcriptional regulator C-terminal domain-containing protein n=1 Tax=Ornithobacterium rhinotracheale TaxID=28251 RepID=UPI00129D05AE|nr:TetR family transcriptional regulator C-terminal domain-containing protein [Ornithobacterium rhinotracheale]MRJ10462.1 TetR/AcrR family transcriptional regulator [Ornithobacterium rhinotracheale]